MRCCRLYAQIACRGRGQSPQPSEVNEAVWHIFAHHQQPELKDKYILLHCTHGFNRTGEWMGEGRE